MARHAEAVKEARSITIPAWRSHAPRVDVDFSPRNRLDELLDQPRRLGERAERQSVALHVLKQVCQRADPERAVLRDAERLLQQDLERGRARERLQPRLRTLHV